MLRSKARLAILAGAALIAASGASCGGGQQRATDMSFTPDPEPDQEKVAPESREDEAFTTPTAVEETATATVAARPLLGVRPDLALSASAPQGARCPCLAVEVGSPMDPKFTWQAGAPKATGPGSLAIAVSSRGVECPGGDPDESKRRPSISAVDVEGNDVVVEIEELRDGPPLASGALIPEPGPGGSIYVRGRTKAVPYGRSATSSRCKVR